MGRKRSAMRSPMPTSTTMASTTVLPTVLRCSPRKPESREARVFGFP
jgi:hypothetical protein